jgi:hypothetical protein
MDPSYQQVRYSGALDLPHRATACRPKIHFINKHWAFFVLPLEYQELTEGSPAELRTLVIKDSRE